MDISIHALRIEGDDLKKTDNAEAQRISIHALRIEGDKVFTAVYPIQDYFNPRPPYRGRQTNSGDIADIKEFQSTPSV